MAAYDPYEVAKANRTYRTVVDGGSGGVADAMAGAPPASTRPTVQQDLAEALALLLACHSEVDLMTRVLGKADAAPNEVELGLVQATAAILDSAGVLLKRLTEIREMLGGL